MLRKLKDARVLVTGASEGIGFEVARRACRAGCQVLMVARNHERLAAAAARMEGPHRAEFLSVDLSDGEARSRFLTDLERRGFAPDLVVNNAGHGASGPYAEEDWPKLDTMLRLNVVALAHLTHWAAAQMRTRGGGSIVNMSAVVATRPTPHFAAYAASKAFVTSLGAAVNHELRGTGVSVSTVHAPAVRTTFASPEKADLRSTLVMKLFPSASPASVARAVLRVAKSGKRSVFVGPIAGLIMATAPIIPRGVDLGLMSFLFKGEHLKRRSRPVL